MEQRETAGRSAAARTGGDRMAERPVPGEPLAPRRVRRVVAGVLVGAAVLAGCADGGPAAAPPLQTSAAPRSATPGGAPPEMPASPLGAPARFVPCDGGFECATVTVPLDHDDPAGPTLPLAIVRQPAKDPTRRAGVLLVNPGGPGGSGIRTVEGGQVPPSAADRFDVIGFDPRGVGRSASLQCPVGPDVPYYGDPDPGDPVGEAQTVDAVARYSQACGDANRALLPHLGTRDVARDMDVIREALREERISYLGYSYGTSIGQVYGELFPQRVRTMVLDGVVDVSQPGLDPSQAESFENSLRQFSADCAADPECLVGPDAIAVLDRVEARVEAQPLPVPGTTPLSAGLLEIGVVLPLYSRSNWPALEQALAAADRGDGSLFRRLADRYFTSSNSDTYNAVTCLDSSWPRNVPDVLAASRAAELRAPHFSGNVLVSGLTCAGWPVPQSPLTPPTGQGLPPVLVLGTTNDPATPYRNSVALAGRLPGSVLLTYRGDGHTVYGNGIACVDDPVSRYLADGVLPAPDTVC